ncbi:MAG: hypothetical protein IPO25_00310 [Saprospiraceae bacterium]|nr:hypothetical protein [Saprospiraceae bacterium]
MGRRPKSTVRLLLISVVVLSLYGSSFNGSPLPKSIVSVAIKPVNGPTPYLLVMPLSSRSDGTASGSLVRPAGSS